MITQVTVFLLLTSLTRGFNNDSECNRIQILPLYGVVIDDINIEDLLSETQTIIDLIYEYGFVVFRNIMINPDELIRLGGNLGNVGNFKQGKMTQHIGSPHHLISAISNNPFYGYVALCDI